MTPEHQHDHAHDAAIVAEKVLEHIARRYGLNSVEELIDDARWVHAHRDRLRKGTWGLIAAMLGTFAWGFAQTIVEGLKVVLRVKGG